MKTRPWLFLLMPLLITGLTFCEKPDPDPAGTVVKLKTSISADFLPFCDSVADIDGNTYKTVKIGSQTWMTENLKTTRYNDGSSILTGSGDAEYPWLSERWFCSEEGAYTWYDFKYVNKETYGGIYNWHAVATGRLCPSGWHVPDESEWIELIRFLGGNIVSYDGASLYCPETRLKESGFNPGPIGEFSIAWGFWTSDFIWTATLTPRHNVPIIVSFERKFEAEDQGYGVRCLKDN